MASNTATTPIPANQAPKLNYLNNGYGLKSWLLTTDHKRIAMLYLISVTAFFILGGFFAMLIRLELLTPEGDLMRSRPVMRDGASTMGASVRFTRRLVQSTAV